MKVKINRCISKDFMSQVVSVIVDDKEVANIFTSEDCPEDNNCDRLCVAKSFESIIKAINPNVEIEYTNENTLE